MRITVELDSTEVQQATEFLSVLRDLARQADIQVRNDSDTKQQRSAAPKQEPPQSVSDDLPSQSRPLTSSITPPPGHQSRPPASQAEQVPFPRRAGSQAQSRPTVPASSPLEPGEAFSTALQRLCASPDPVTIEQVSSQVQETANRLKTQGTEPSEPLYKALAQLLFDSAALQAGQSRLFLLTLVQGLQDPLKASVFNSLTQAALGELTQAHSPDADRHRFLPQAEAFVGLITSGYIKVEWAIQTIASMLDKAWMRCAALTMLGKTIEHAHQQLLQDCNPAVLEALRAALGKVTEPEFTYDIDYAASFLGWEELRHAPQDANGGLDAAAQDRSSQGHAKSLVGRMSMAGHSAEILAVAWHAASAQILTTDTDGCVAVWRPSEGCIGHRTHVPGRKFSSMAVLDVAGTAIVALAGLDSSGTPPAVQTCVLRDGQLHSSGAIPVEASHVSAVAAAEGSHILVAGTARAGHAYQCTVHDLRSLAASGVAAAAAVATFRGAHDRATCLTAVDQHLFACGTQAGKIALWDRRAQSSPVQSLAFSGASPRGGAGGRGITACLSSVAAQGDLLLGGTLGGTVALWDRRMVRGSTGQAAMELQPDGQPVSCVRFAPAAAAPHSAVVATVEGLYLLDLQSSPAGCSRAAFAQIAAKQQQQQPGLYKDLAWADPSPVLFCGGASTQLDVYNVC